MNPSVPPSSPPHILVADDEPLFLRTTGELLRKAGYQCTCVDDAHAALKVLGRERFDLVLADLNMPGNLQFELLHQGRSQFPETPLIVVTGAPTLPSAIESVRLGIADYLLKPVKLQDLLNSISRALRAGKPPVPARSASAVAPQIIGESPAIQQVCDIVSRIAHTDVHVLITGESGTGKEVVARVIHHLSRRSSANFQAVDCTAIPEGLSESTLFGHVRGAFTGAVNDQPGLLERAEGGTVFLDEIGDMPLILQAKLLRVVQEHAFTPVGRQDPVQLDTRFISATNRQIEHEVDAGRFRRDLFYRLAVVHITLPPLRDRGDDVLLLASHFLTSLANINPAVRGLSAETVELLRQYRWPGNVRELRNVIERALSLARGSEITPDDLPPALHGRETAEPERIEGGRRRSRLDAVVAAERDYIVGLLTRNHGNVSQSAREAGMTRQGFHKLLSKHGIHAA
ncbi:MAG TPA: sigma-54 dependent transcriptional regulator, partial [Planctomycetaceae bacterium]|nr:sigma-54 dependent transcriptional regulator [Planctomycetaceae bacterium]